MKLLILILLMLPLTCEALEKHLKKESDERMEWLKKKWDRQDREAAERKRALERPYNLYTPHIFCEEAKSKSFEQLTEHWKDCFIIRKHKIGLEFIATRPVFFATYINTIPKGGSFVMDENCNYFSLDLYGPACYRLYDNAGRKVGKTKCIGGAR